MKSKRDSRPTASASRNLGITRARDLLNQAFSLHQGGRLEEAERLYRQSLRADTLPDAHHMLGLLLHQQGRSGDAVAQIEKALRLAPQAANFHLSYGAVLAALGHLGPASAAFRRVLAWRPSDQLAFRNLATAEIGFDRAEPALVAAARACALDRKDPIAWTAHAHAARRLGRLDAAAGACRAALAVDPTSDEARFILASIEGDPSRPPPAYVRDVFDKYAGHFDRDLERLGYRTPEMLADMAVRHLKPEAKSLSVLDLGCGTGLAAVSLASLAHRMVGLDLSPAMLAEARKRGLYADLIESDIESMAFGERFDLVVAADVLNYLGDLGPAFEAIDRALAEGGAILFSVEELTDGDRFRLTGDLRYAHAGDHLRHLASARNWIEIASDRAELRRQSGKSVDGLLFLFRKG